MQTPELKIHVDIKLISKDLSKNVDKINGMQNKSNNKWK